MAVCQLGNLVTWERTAGLNHNKTGFLNTKFQKQLSRCGLVPSAELFCHQGIGLSVAKLGLLQCQLPS